MQLYVEVRDDELYIMDSECHSQDVIFPSDTNLTNLLQKWGESTFSCYVNFNI